jgi:hypothetical protein
MANIVKTKLKVHLTDSEELDRLQKAIETNNLLKTYLPIPEKMITVPTWSTKNLSRSEIIKRETLQNMNLALTGYKNTSDFLKFRWGTKWDIYPDAKVKRVNCWKLTAVIETAWDAPVTEKIKSLKDPNVTVIIIKSK